MYMYLTIYKYRNTICISNCILNMYTITSEFSEKIF